jgi:hypothetical protein
MLTQVGDDSLARQLVGQGQRAEYRHQCGRVAPWRLTTQARRREADRRQLPAQCPGRRLQDGQAPPLRRSGHCRRAQVGRVVLGARVDDVPFGPILHGIEAGRRQFDQVQVVAPGQAQRRRGQSLSRAILTMKVPPQAQRNPVYGLVMEGGPDSFPFVHHSPPRQAR